MRGLNQFIVRITSEYIDLVIIKTCIYVCNVKKFYLEQNVLLQNINSFIIYTISMC